MKNLLVFLFACCVQAISAHIAFIADSGKGSHIPGADQIDCMREKLRLDEGWKFSSFCHPLERW